MPDLRYVSANGLRIAVNMGGPEAAPPIVLLHGLGEPTESWAVVRPSFQRDYRVIAPDLRGHGRTDWPGEYSIELMAADTIALLDELNVDRVALIGHSVGGIVAYRIAEMHPERVERLIIEDVPPPYPRVGPPLPDRPEGVELPFDWDMLIAIRAQVDDPDMTARERLGQITAKTLIVAGGHKSHVSQEKIAEAAELIPDATVVTIDAGHHVHVGRPELFGSTVHGSCTGASYPAVVVAASRLCRQHVDVTDRGPDERLEDSNTSDYRGWTRLQLWFRLFGPNLDPQRITDQIDVRPTRAFCKGERPAPRVRHLAEWQWRSDWCNDQSAKPLIDELLDVLGPHRAVLHDEVTDGAAASVTIVGHTYGMVIESPAEADKRGWYSGGDGEPFVPFFAASPVGLTLDRDFLEFLVAVGATFDTDIAVGLDAENH